MGNLEGKIALVTGASRGIGREIAQRLAHDGALVAVHYGTRQAEAEEVVDNIQQNGGKAFAIGANLKRFDGVHNLYQSLDDALHKHAGNNRFDILVNNAGIGQVTPIEETTEESFDEVMNINVKAPVFITQQALSRLNEGGRIINISSFVTRVASPSVLTYSISKGAVNTFTYAMAQHLGKRNITVNAILPGYTHTEMNASTYNNPESQKHVAGLSTFNRWGEPKDVADIAAFLASSDSRWITGQLIDASGGSYL
ncbi:SDR family oxidoreductase [Paenibacillus albidus]|uniref:SDR family oxidoreductase n=1 Tax=Paenibacillus albidus TaxID=2041023 RepID=UPI001BE9BDBE|nr:SDR family oxidoreductase [Paenibacillus albidus]MBT2290374.1 SDR family oxidoreductase [Paenibacillus albidus]